MSIRPSALFGNEIAARYCVPYFQILQQTKRYAVAKARQEYWFRLVFDLGYTLPRAAAVTGHHHTSALHGIRAFARDHLGTPYKSSLETIREAWIYSSLESLEEAA